MPLPEATSSSGLEPRTATTRAGRGPRVKPAHLSDAGGVRYQEFSNLNDPVAVVAESDEFDLSAAAAGDRLGRRTDQRGSEGDRRLRPPALRPFPAVVSDHARAGRITTVKLHVPEPGALAADLVRYGWPLRRSRRYRGTRSRRGVGDRATRRASLRRRSSGYTSPHNWSWTLRVAPAVMTDVLAERDGTTRS